MGRATKALLAGAGVLGLGAVAARARRSRSPDRSGGDGGVTTLTVFAPVDQVARAWETNPAGDQPGRREEQPPVSPPELAPAPGDRGTEVRARVAGGDPGLVQRFGGGADRRQLRERLRRFKALVEAGEVITTEGQPTGRGPMAERLTRAVTRRLRAGSGS
jgi:hypothetical protein